MLTNTTGSLAPNADMIALPDDYSQSYDLRFTGIYSRIDLRRRTLDYVRSQWSYDGNGNRVTGRPQCWATDATVIRFDTLADVALPYDFAYYRSLPALAPGNNTNFLTSGYPRLLRSVCTAFGYEHRKNQQEKLYWLKLAIAEIDEANVNSDEELAGTEINMEIPG